MKTLFFPLVITALTLAHQASAQTCNGETVHFRETFGSGSGASALPGGRTNYVYKNTGALSDGDYRLSSTTQGRPEWHNVADHTGNTDGRMMVTNASYTPGEFYRDTVFGLSATNTYTVYFHAMNVNTPGTCSPNPILPRLELIVESYNSDGSFTQLSSITSDYLPQTSPAVWVRIAGTYYLPVGVTAIRYRIINNSTGGCGNDVAIDDITFSQCQPMLLASNGLSLKGRKDKSSVMLTWKSKDEYAAFDVEKSDNGSTWTIIRNLKASANKEYQFEDAVSNNNTAQYRIAAINAAGRRFYSNIINLKDLSNALKLNTFPNPFENEVKMQMTVEQAQPNASVRLFDMRGKLVSSRSWNMHEGENNLSLSALNLQPGVYFVSVVDRNGTMLAQQRVMRK